jgi:hypothetical protein
MHEKEVTVIELTEQHWQELRHDPKGECRVSDPETRQEYVILRAEVYDRLKGLLYDDSDWTPEEQLRLIAESGKRAGWDDPSMNAYDNYDENLKKLCQ